MGARRRLAWIPPMLVGFAAATCAELAGGLLLYSGPGFLRALTLLLGVELGALALGLWVAGAGRPGDPMERARRRWLFCLVAFTAASGFAAAWQMVEGAASSFGTRGLGLALLGALPLYASGAVLGALDLVDRGEGDAAAPDPSRAGTGPGVAALGALGASAGFLTTGLVLLAALQPVSILLLCVVLVSAGALLHGWIHEAEEPSSSASPTRTTTTTSTGPGSPASTGTSPPPPFEKREEGP